MAGRYFDLDSESHKNFERLPEIHFIDLRSFVPDNVSIMP